MLDFTPPNSKTLRCKTQTLLIQSPIEFDLTKDFSFARISLFVTKFIAEFFNPCLDVLEATWHKTLGAQMSQQLLLCVCLFVSMMTTMKYFFYILWNPRSQLPRRPSHHGLETKLNILSSRISIDQEVSS